MAGPTTGGVYNSRGRWFARVNVAKKTRRSVLLPHITTEPDAKARALAINALVRLLRESERGEFIEKVIEQAATANDEQLAKLRTIVAGICGGTEKASAKRQPLLEADTFRSISKRWTSGELARDYPDHVERKRSWRDDEYRSKHVPAQYRDLPLAAWTTDTYEEIMRTLSKSLGSGSRPQVAQYMHRVFELAVYPLRLVPVNPIPRMPKVKQDKLLATLYPDEAAAVAKCKEVEIGYRLLWAFLAETGWRISEAVGRQEPKGEEGEDESIPPLLWKDIDFEHGRACLSRTKTTETVNVPLDPPTLDGLEAWRKITPNPGPSDRVFVTKAGQPITVVLAAETFRAHLTMAGISREKRPDLFPENEELKRRLAVRVHDLRGLFVTAALAQGQSDTWVRERTRHRTPGMLDTYRRNVPHFRKYGPVVPMVDAIPELASSGCTKWRRIEEEFTISRFQRVDSNHDKRNQNPLSCH